MCHTVLQYYIHCGHTDVHFICCDDLSWYPTFQDDGLSVEDRDHATRRGVAHSYERKCRACVLEEFKKMFGAREQQNTGLVAWRGFAASHGNGQYDDGGRLARASVAGGGNERPDQSAGHLTTLARRFTSVSDVGNRQDPGCGIMDHGEQVLKDLERCQRHCRYYKGIFPRLRRASSSEVNATIRHYIGQTYGRSSAVMLRYIILPGGSNSFDLALQYCWRALSDPVDAAYVWRIVTGVLSQFKDQNNLPSSWNTGDEGAVALRIPEGERYQDQHHVLTYHGAKLVFLWLAIIIKEYHSTQRRLYLAVMRGVPVDQTRRDIIMALADKNIRDYLNQFELSNLNHYIDLAINDMTSVVVLGSLGAMPSRLSQKRLRPLPVQTQVLSKEKPARNCPTHNPLFGCNHKSMKLEQLINSYRHGSDPKPADDQDKALQAATHRLLIHFGECDHYNAVVVVKPIAPPELFNAEIDMTTSSCGCRDFPVELLKHQRAESKNFCLICRNERLHRDNIDEMSASDEWKQFMFNRQVEMIDSQRMIRLWPMQMDGYWEGSKVEYR